MTDSQKLLADYVNNGSEAAFQEVVVRHLDLVYSVAVRLVGGDTHLAQDVAQTVFMDLARMAKSLSHEVRVGGWLHRHTCFVAAKTMRGERRRQFRERQAVEMNAQQDHSKVNLAQVAPILDEAINQLGAKDRAAILLRFFEGLDFRSVGEALGTNEAAAQKRVTRALEKLQRLLKQPGTAFSAAALGTALASEAVTAAPAGLAASLSSAALAGASGTASAITLLSLMTLTKTKTCLITALVFASVVISLVIQHQAEAKSRAQDQSLRQKSEQLAQLATDNERLSTLATQANGTAENGRLNELEKLRAEAALLRQQTKELPTLREAARRLDQPPPREPQTMLQIAEHVWAKQECAQTWIRAFIAYARENQGQLPATFEQAEPFWPKEIRRTTGSADDQFEILYHGPLDLLTNRDVIVFREKKLWPYGNENYGSGKFGRFYALANGHVQYSSSSDKTAGGNFDEYEKEHTAPPISQ
jgi:RNA polymerase sigma factor (sigma-70 family)